MGSVAANAVEVDSIRVLHGTLEKEKCILGLMEYTVDDRDGFAALEEQ